MPHLSPMMWALMPMFLTLMIYYQMIMLSSSPPTCFPHIKSKSLTMPFWKWYVKANF